jgi:hypothetical protein
MAEKIFNRTHYIRIDGPDRQSKPKLRPIDPEFWTVEDELPDPIRALCEGWQ